MPATSRPRSITACSNEITESATHAARASPGSSHGRSDASIERHDGSSTTMGWLPMA